MSIWDDPEIRTGGEFIKLEAPGDTVSGTVLAIRAHRWDDGKVSPQIILDVDGEERTLTAGQVRLKAILAEQRPEAGDHLTVTLTEIEKRAGGKTLKHFDVQVGRGGAPVARPAVTPAAASATPAASGGQYTPEQIEAMKLLGMPVPQ